MPKIKKSRRVADIPIIRIRPCRTQPRKSYDDEEIKELSMSIRRNGLIQPVIVRRAGSREYELIAGERRLRACVMCGKTRIPCIVISCSDNEAGILSLEENIQRADLNIFETAQGISDIISSLRLKKEEAAGLLCKKSDDISSITDILQLDDTERRLILRSHLSVRHAKALLMIKDKQERRMLLSEIIEYNLNVSQTEGYVKSLLEKTALEKLQEQRKKGIIKDIRLFENTITKALTALISSGLDAEQRTYYDDGCVEYVIRVPMERSSCDEKDHAA